jgi:hypothetical protein
MLGIHSLLLGTFLLAPTAPYPQAAPGATAGPEMTEAPPSAAALPDPFGPRGGSSDLGHRRVDRHPELADPFADAATAKRVRSQHQRVGLVAPFADDRRRPGTRVPSRASALPDPFAA